MNPQSGQTNGMNIENPAIEPLLTKLKKVIFDPNISFKEKVRFLSQDQEIYREVSSILTHEGFSNKKVILCTKVFATNPNERNEYFYELEYKDLQDLFSHFGKLERMFFRRTTASHMEAITIFKDNVNAFIAQRMLDGFNLDDPRVTLDVKFVQERLEEEEDTQRTGFTFHCKYEVTINDNQFQPYRRLCGAKDCNKLRLKDLASKDGSNDCGGGDDDVRVDIRYGDSHKHSTEKDDFIYLTVMAKTAEKYAKASSLSMELMANLFEEYKLFCDEKNIPISYDIRIKKFEYVQNDCLLLFIDEKKKEDEVKESSWNPYGDSGKKN